MMSFRRRRKTGGVEQEGFNMTPMIDVTFQLLIFFMLTMHFKEVEGKLLSQLPKHTGPAPRPQPNRLEEVRLVLCAGGDVERHLNDKGAHAAARRDGAVCEVFVERRAIGQVYKTEVHADKAGHNRAVYRRMGATAAELHALLPRGADGAPAPVIVDADPEVPYEHVIGAVDACHSRGLTKVEFSAPPPGRR